MPSTRCFGVDSALPKLSLPLLSSKTATSVKVPPISAANRNCSVMNGPWFGNRELAWSCGHAAQLDDLPARLALLGAALRHRQRHLMREIDREMRDDLGAHIFVELARDLFRFPRIAGGDRIN